jgi:excisionase family DNA binding protein
VLRSSGMPSPLLTLREASEIAELEQSWLRRQVYAGHLKATLYGKTWLVTRRDLDAFMAMERPTGRPPRRGGGHAQARGPTTTEG